MRPNLLRCLLFLLAPVLALAPSLLAQQSADYAFGAGLSLLKQVEDSGVKFTDAGAAKPGLQILRDHGYNWIRLRIRVKSNGRQPSDVPPSSLRFRPAP